MNVQTRSDSGSAAVELVLLTPVLVVLMLFVVYAGRLGEGMSEVHHAADQGARAASQVSWRKMESAARSAVLADLRTSGSSCVNPSVTTTPQRSGVTASVTVTVTCRVSNAGVSLLGVGSRVVRATSSEIIDHYRTDG